MHALPPAEASRVVGGMFGLTQLATSPRRRVAMAGGADTRTRLAGGSVPGRLALASGRGAIALAIALLGARRVWLPSYLCPVLVRAAGAAEIAWYPIDERLRVADDGWLRLVRPGDLVVAIDYFGAPFDPGLDLVVERGAWLLEDAAQAQHGAGRAPADLLVRSPRKWYGLADGATLEARSDRGTALLAGFRGLPPADPRWLARSRGAAARRARFDDGAGPPDWYGAFRGAEEAVPVQPQAMSRASSHRLAEIEADAATLQDSAAARRANAGRLLEGLGTRALIPDLLERGIPIGIPVRFGSRDRVRDALAQERVFAPVHWQLGTAVPSRFRASHALAGEVLTLPCDERATLADMDRTLRVIDRSSR